MLIGDSRRCAMISNLRIIYIKVECMEEESPKVAVAQSPVVWCATCKFEIGTDCKHPDHEKPGFFDLPESSCWQKKVFLKNPD